MPLESTTAEEVKEIKEVINKSTNLNIGDFEIERTNKFEFESGKIEFMVEVSLEKDLIVTHAGHGNLKCVQITDEDMNIEIGFPNRGVTYTIRVKL